MIEAQELTKRYGDKTAVGVSSTIAPGSVTGFLGPNGAGKSTTMRMIMGLDRPTSGTVTINGKPYAKHRSPLSEAGALLDAKAVHPGRSARSHMRTMAATHKIPAARVDDVIEMTGLTTVAGKRVGGFSLGMGQRQRPHPDDRGARRRRLCAGAARGRRGGPPPTRRLTPMSCPPRPSPRASLWEDGRAGNAGGGPGWRATAGSGRWRPFTPWTLAAWPGSREPRLRPR
jgi:hypothetical protein